jgi:hypothetical protein
MKSYFKMLKYNIKKDEHTNINYLLQQFQSANT